MPLAGAIALAQRQNDRVIEDAARGLADHLRQHGEPHLADAVEGALPGDPSRLPQRVLALFTHGMGGLLDVLLYANGQVDREATELRDELAERLHAEAKSQLR